MQDTKLTFSDEEMEAIRNKRFFEVKLDVTQKILHLFGNLESELGKKISRYDFLSSQALGIDHKGKIFKGENYQSLPYLILDCPKVFTTETVFAFRSMFWWGHELSFTLHVQGRALDFVRDLLIENISMLKGTDFFFCVNDTPWDYYFEDTNYKNLDELLSTAQGKELLNSGKFIKLSRKLELADHDQVIGYGVETFEKLMDALQ